MSYFLVKFILSQCQIIKRDKVYTFNKKISRSQIEWEKYKERMIEKEREAMHDVAEHLGVDTDEEGLAERIGLGKTLPEKLDEFEKLVNGDWMIKKTKEGNVFVSIGEVKTHRPKDKKGVTRNYGRIQVTVNLNGLGILL